MSVYYKDITNYLKMKHVGIMANQAILSGDTSETGSVKLLLSIQL